MLLNGCLALLVRCFFFALKFLMESADNKEEEMVYFAKHRGIVL